MGGDLSLTALAVVLAMSGVTYATKAGGFWILNRIELSESARDALDVLPGGIIVAFLTVRLLNGGAIEWVAGLAVLVVARETGNVLLAMGTGVGVLLILRGGIVGFL